MEEADAGLRRGLLIPVLIEDIGPPLGFGSLQAADLSGWSGDPGDARPADFMAAVEGLVAPPSRRATPEDVATNAPAVPRSSGEHQRGADERPRAAAATGRGGSGGAWAIGALAAAIVAGAAWYAASRPPAHVDVVATPSTPLQPERPVALQPPVASAPADTAKPPDVVKTVDAVKPPDVVRTVAKRPNLVVMPDAKAKAACPVAAAPPQLTARMQANGVENQGHCYDLANGLESCTQACLRIRQHACDLDGLAVAAASLDACKRVVGRLGGPGGLDFARSGQYPDDMAGCTYGDWGDTDKRWVQVMRKDGQGPACDTVNADPARMRVCACL